MKKFVNSICRLIPAICMSGMLLLSGCQEGQNDVVKKSDLSEVPDSMSVSIEEAKDYFNKNFSSATVGQENKRTVEGSLKNKTLKWDKAGYKKISFGEAVIVPMEFENLNLIINEKTRAYVPYNQLNYLMMYKDKQKSVRTEW